MSAIPPFGFGNFINNSADKIREIEKTNTFKVLRTAATAVGGTVIVANSVLNLEERRRQSMSKAKLLKEKNGKEKK